MWIGLLNKDFVDCGDKTACIGKLFWVDGSVMDSTDHMSSVDGNGAQYCVRMHNSGGKVGDKDCSVERPFVCQFDCDIPFVGETIQRKDV